MKKDETLTIKLSEDMLKKLAFVAEEEGRSLNNHMLMLIKNNIEYYERVHKITIKTN